MSVRTRLTRTLVLAIALTALVFAALSMLVVDRALHASSDARLLTVAQAIASAVDVHHGVVSLDPSDLAELGSLHAGVPFALLDERQNLVAGDPQPPAGGLAFARAEVQRKGITYGTVVAWQSNAWIAALERSIAIASLAVALLIVGLGTLAARRAASAALAPLERIASLAERIEGRDLSQRLGTDGSDELGRLCASFDRMLDRLQEAFARERRFAADASHELRAPLAVVRAETELALRRDRDVLEYRAAIESIAREAARLEELVDELLAAARCEVDARGSETFDACELVQSVIARATPAAHVRAIDVRADANERIAVRANAATVERAILAVVHNAITFASEGGTVRLDVAREGECGVRIDVADDGPGFTPAGLEHATERFWRGDGARPRGGTGLGLSIARTMIEANGGSLQLDNRPSGGALVSIRLGAS